MLRLPHFIAAGTSINQIFLSFPGRSHISPQLRLKRCFPSEGIPLFPIPTCIIILFFSTIRSLCNKSSSTLSCNTPFLYIHWSYPICRSFSINELSQFSPVFLGVPFWYSLISDESNVWLFGPASYYPTQCCSVLWPKKKVPLGGMGHTGRVSVPFL